MALAVFPTFSALAAWDAAALLAAGFGANCCLGKASNQLFCLFLPPTRHTHFKSDSNG